MINIEKLKETVKKIENFFSLRNIRKYELKQEVKLKLILAVLSYFICFIFLLIMNKEKDYSSLTQGPLIMILFFVMLILFIVNFSLFTYEFKKERYILKIPTRLEITLRFLVFLLVFLNLKDLGLDISIQSKMEIVGVAFILSLCFIAYMYNKVKNHKMDINNYEYSFHFTEKDIINYEQNKYFVSDVGLILYIYSCYSINNGYATSILKVIAFYFSCKFIIDKLKNCYSSEKEKKHILKIVIFLSLGFVVNIIGISIIQVYFKNITKANFYGIKDVLFIFAAICELPLAKEYQRLYKKSIELGDYIKKRKELFKRCTKKAR